MITLDGSAGGGAVVRLGVGLSAATGKDVRIINIREGRNTQGLGHQHIAGVQAVKKMTDAETEGLSPGSRKLVFQPSDISSRSVRVDIPTAGSVALTLQPAMIAAAAAEKPVKVRVSGGATAGKWAPTIHYLKEVALPILARSGFEGTLDVRRHGFYPDGGAVVDATLDGSGFGPVDCTERGPVERIRGVSWASKELSGDAVAERQQDAARGTLLEQLPQETAVDIRVETVETLGPGSAIQLWAETAESRVGGSAIGERGVTAERVGTDAGQALAYAIMTDSPLDEHMSDQVIPFIGLEGGRVRVRDFTDHVMTALAVTEEFTDYTLDMEREKNLLTAE